jgi:hypothetical protein
MSGIMKKYSHLTIVLKGEELTTSKKAVKNSKAAEAPSENVTPEPATETVKEGN